MKKYMFLLILISGNVFAQRPIGPNTQNEQPHHFFERMYDKVSEKLSKCNSKAKFERPSGNGGRFHEFYEVLKNQYLKDGLKVGNECAPGGEKIIECLVKGSEYDLFDFVTHEKTPKFLRENGGYRPDEIKEILDQLRLVNPKHVKILSGKLKGAEDPDKDKTF